MQCAVVLTSEWLLTDLGLLLWMRELAEFGCTARRARAAVEKSWQLFLALRGFTSAATRLLSQQVGQLERWGGQRWDVWQFHIDMPDGRHDMVLLHQWEFGCAVLLNSISNGWFDFKVSTHAPIHSFLFHGIVDDREDVGAIPDINEELDKLHSVQPRRSSPLLKLLHNYAVCWHWALDDRLGLVITHSGRHLENTPWFTGHHSRTSLCFTASGFQVFHSSCGDTPALAIQHGVVTLRHSRTVYHESAVERAASQYIIDVHDIALGSNHIRVD